MSFSDEEYMLYGNIDCDHNSIEKTTNIITNKNDDKTKKSSKYVPYSNILEYLKAEKRHGPWICAKDKSETFKLIVYQKEMGLLFSGSYYKDFDVIFKYYMWQDGTPCGKIKK